LRAVAHRIAREHFEDTTMHKLLRQSLVMLLLMTLLTGVVYPLLVTGVGQVVFEHAANGSVLENDGKPLGSELIGQAFSDAKYFWPRPSATAPFANNPSASSASNLGPKNTALTAAVKQPIDALRAADPGNTAPVPVDLVTASASGVDPHISPAAAQYQLARVARVRNMTTEDVTKLVERATEARQLAFMGEPRVNVLKLNLMLDGKW
jgi:K+-transporting ATPase ATPase C chain